MIYLIDKVECNVYMDTPTQAQFSTVGSYREYLRNPTVSNFTRIQRRDEENFKDWCTGGGGDWIDVDGILDNEGHAP